LELVDVGGFYFIVAQNQTDLTGLMPRKRTTPPQPYGQGKKLKAFRCTEKTSRLLKKAAKRKISEAAYIEAALEDRFRKGGSLAAKGLGETYPRRPRDLNAYESRDQKPAEANCGSLQTASAGKMRRNKPHRSV